MDEKKEKIRETGKEDRKKEKQRVKSTNKTERKS
jgi:hypothetical protein